MPRHSRDLRDDAGSALTEFALVAPLFIVLVFWAQFFVDLGVLKLKVEEAARYAVWEMVAQRNPGVVQSEVAQRFADLASPEQYSGTVPVGARSWQSVTVSATIRDNMEAKFENGRLERPSGGGIINQILGAVASLLNKTVDWMVRKMGLPLNGEAEAQVQFQVRNSLFPSGSILGIFFDTGINPQIRVRAKSPPLMWETWKAWPGKNAASSKSVETNVYDTYPRLESTVSATEKEVAARVHKMAFLTFTDEISQFTQYLEYIKLPDPFGMTPWKQNYGPITMLPGAPAKHSWVPGNGQAVRRFGDVWEKSLTAPGTVSWSADNPKVDRARVTVPTTTTSQFWTDDGGETRGSGGGDLKLGARMLDTSRNKYRDLYNCRDAYYMGSVREQLKHYGDPQWTRRAFAACR